MKTKAILVAIVTGSVMFTSCLPQISIKAGKGDEATIFFSTGFSPATARTLQTAVGTDENTPLFNKNDILMVLNSAGATNTSASLPSPTEISTEGTLPELSKHPLSMTGLIKKTKKSLTLTLGAKQISAFYELLNDDAKSYLDLMMLPALIGEKMSKTEYRDLLASMYGPNFADEIVNGKLTIALSSPDGKKSVKKSVNLGELLTSEEEMSWSLEF